MDSASDDELFSGTYVPPPPPDPGKFVIRSKDNRFPVLHLTPDEVLELHVLTGKLLEDWRGA
jgi:hypothetical protein